VEPHAAFADRRQIVLYGNHPRRRPLEPGDEKKLSLDKILDIYRARFANAADFTFVFVGSVTPEKLGPLLVRYLGALPARPGRHETWRDLKIRPVEGVHKFEVRKGVEPQSVVGLTFTGQQRWSREEDHVMDSLVEAMGIRLREVLREGMSGTYNVNVGGDLIRRPQQQYQTTISFGCAPENVESLLAATFHELDTARTSVPAPLVDKVRAAQRRTLEQRLRSNSFWLGELVEHLRYDDDPALILRQGELIDALTAPRLEDAARRYFDQRQYVLGTLQPATPAVSSGTRKTSAAQPAATAAPAAQ
jgi:zinc protease